ncbi:MAG: hypothetical protein ABSB18_02965 [Candidatus Omnitrophota bacterium]
MAQKEFSSDELEIIEGWRLVKQHKKGYIHVILKSDGTQFYLEITPAKEGKVAHNRLT